MRARIKRTRSGEFVVKLSDDERTLLRRLPAELAELLKTDDPSLRRLFPPAYADEPDREAEYRRLMGDDLLASHSEALTVMEATIDSERLAEVELMGWLRAINSLRLVLGTRLDVSEDMYDTAMDPEDPRAGAFALYSYLGWLEEEVVEALAG